MFTLNTHLVQTSMYTWHIPKWVYLHHQWKPQWALQYFCDPDISAEVRFPCAHWYGDSQSLLHTISLSSCADISCWFYKNTETDHSIKQSLENRNYYDSNTYHISEASQNPYKKTFIKTHTGGQLSSAFILLLESSPWRSRSLWQWSKYCIPKTIKHLMGKK